MKINVDSPIKQKDIIETLESQKQPVYHFLGQNKFLKTQIQFEVEDIPEGMDVAAYTKRLIKSQPYGSALALRVLEEGKYW